METEIVNILENISEDVDDVYLSNSLNDELKIGTPSITIWYYDKILNITSTSEYNEEHKDKEMIYKVCDVYSEDIIKDIYGSISHANDKNIKLKNLIGIFTRAKIIE